MTTINIPKYGNVNTDRLGKMLGPEKNATSLRKTGWYGFWKMCGISTDGTKAREQKLQQMYNDFHSDVIEQPATNHTRQIPNNNIERFIVFNKMCSVVNAEFLKTRIPPPEFRAIEIPSETGMTADLQFSIGGHRIASKPANFLEREVIKHFVEADGKLKSDITANSVRQQQQQQQAATRIQAWHRGNAIRHDPYLQIKKRIQMHEKALAKIIKFSGTADNANKVPYRKYQIGQKLNGYYEKTIPGIVDCLSHNFANCSTYTRALYCLIMEDSKIPAEFKRTLKVSVLGNGEDHSFLTSAPKMHQKQVHDGWFHLVHLPEKVAYRQHAVLPSEKERGFDGDEESYKAFITAHSDGKYIKHNQKHRIIEKSVDSSLEDSRQRKLVWKLVYGGLIVTPQLVTERKAL